MCKARVDARDTMLRRRQPYVAPMLCVGCPGNTPAHFQRTHILAQWPAPLAPVWAPGCQVPAPSYPGERLGLPQHGPGSIARFGRRSAALFVDWLLCYGLAALAMTFGLVSQA